MSKFFFFFLALLKPNTYSGCQSQISRPEFENLYDLPYISRFYAMKMKKNHRRFHTHQPFLLYLRTIKRVIESVPWTVPKRNNSRSRV